jgi:hypothetical protein
MRQLVEVTSLAHSCVPAARLFTEQQTRGSPHPIEDVLQLVRSGSLIAWLSADAAVPTCLERIPTDWFKRGMSICPSGRLIRSSVEQIAMKIPSGYVWFVRADLVELGLIASVVSQVRDETTNKLRAQLPTGLPATTVSAGIAVCGSMSGTTSSPGSDWTHACNDEDNPAEWVIHRTRDTLPDSPPGFIYIDLAIARIMERFSCPPWTARTLLLAAGRTGELTAYLIGHNGRRELTHMDWENGRVPSSGVGAVGK